MTDGDLEKLRARADQSNDENRRDDLIAALQEEITEEKDKRREERFIWALIFIVLFDIYVFERMQNWGGPIAILVLQVLGLLIVAKRMGIEEVAVWINRLLGRYSEPKKSEKSPTKSVEE